MYDRKRKSHQLVEKPPEREINVAIRILEMLEEEGHGTTLQHSPRFKPGRLDQMADGVL